MFQRNRHLALYTTLCIALCTTHIACDPGHTAAPPRTNSAPAVVNTTSSPKDTEKQKKTTTAPKTQTNASHTTQPSQKTPNTTRNPLVGPLPIDAKASRDRTCTPRQGIPQTPRLTNQLSPKYNARHEAHLIAPKHTPTFNTTKGDWELTRGASPKMPPPAYASMLVFKGPGANMSEGMIRAQIDVGPSLDMTFMFRTTLNAKGTPEGYGVRLFQNTAQLVKLTSGKAVALSEAESIYRLKRRKSLELIIYALGPELFVQVHDGRSGVELLNVHATDSAFKQGRLGIHVPANHINAPQVNLVRLTSRAACSNIPQRPRGVKKPPRRFVQLTQGPKALSKTLQSKLKWLEQTDRTTHHYQTDAIGYEHLYCDKAITPKHVTVEIPWKFVDADYLHYKNKPIVQDRTGLRTDLSFKNPRMVEHLMRAFHKRYPTSTRLKVLGWTHEKRPILALAIAHNIKKNDPRPALLLNAAHHGDEPLSTEIAFDAISTILKQQKRNRLIKRTLKEFVVWVVPQVNPDGASAFLEHTWRTGRKNGRDINKDGTRDRFEGVDLNRNYPFMWGQLDDRGSSPDSNDSRYRGTKAASEPETQAMMTLVNNERFGASISYHAGTVCLLAPYTIEGVKDPEPNEAWDIGKYVTKQMPMHPEGRPFKLKRSLYAVSGTDQDWFRHTHGTVGLLVEAVRRTPRFTCERRLATQTNRASWLALFKRTINGPTLIGTTTTADGKPIEATITIKEQTLHNNERWTSRPRDGVFMRYLIKPGRYTITASAPNHIPTTKTITIRRGLTKQQFTLKPKN